jgi:hypothetical protein
MGSRAAGRALLVGVLAAVWPALAAAQAAQQIRCGSRNFEYNFCRVGGITTRQVEIARRDLEERLRLGPLVGIPAQRRRSPPRTA